MGVSEAEGLEKAGVYIQFKNLRRSRQIHVWVMVNFQSGISNSGEQMNKSLVTPLFMLKFHSRISESKP